MTTAISDKLTIPKGTYGININFTVYNNDGTVHNLTSYDTVKFKVWKKEIPGTLIVDGACAGMAADGTCYYTVAENDFATVGSRYLWELEMTKTAYRDNTDPAELFVTESG